MITPDLLEEFRGTFPTLGAYNEAVEDVVLRLGIEAGLRLAWWTASGYPAPWKETDGKARYEKMALVPVECPVFCHTPDDPPRAGRWMLHDWHDVWNQRLVLRVLAVVDGSADDWWSLWEAIQTFKVSGRAVGSNRGVFWADVGGCRLTWSDVIHDLATFTDPDRVPVVAAAIKAIVPAADLELGPGTLPWTQFSVMRGPLACDRMKSEFGFEPAIPLESGIAQFADWMRNHPESYA